MMKLTWTAAPCGGVVDAHRGVPPTRHEEVVARDRESDELPNPVMKLALITAPVVALKLGHRTGAVAAARHEEDVA